MPKEVVHWIVAGRTARLLASGPFGPALRRCPNGLLLGAVFHDALFYLVGSHPAGLKALPHRLHGSHGEDPFDLLRLQAVHMHARSDSPLPTAFFVGLASHVFTDATIHPLVYHLTGNYYDRDPQRRTRAVRHHRAFECLLDMAAAGGPGAVRNRSLRALVDALEGPLPLACPPENLARLAGCSAAAAKKGMTDALNLFCSMQSFARLPSLSRFLRDISAMLPDKLREIAALFYAPQLWGQRAAVASRMTFRNPVTDAASTATLAELMELSARRTAAFCEGQAAALRSGAGLVGRGLGPSLDMGLPGVSVDQARFFAARPLPAE